MKRYALVVSLALLFAAFIWSCQQQASAPLSPEGSISLGKKPVAPTYTIEVFFDENNGPDPELDANGKPVEKFISVAKLDKAAGGARGTAVSGFKEIIPLNLTQTLAAYFRAEGKTVLGEVTQCFKHFFDVNGNLLEGVTPIVGELSVGERDGNPYDALAYFFTDDKVEPSLTMFMWGVIPEDPDKKINPQGEGIWRLPGPDEQLVVTGDVTNPDPPPGGPDRVGIRIEFGKKKSKEACLGGIPNQPWRVVITLNE